MPRRKTKTRWSKSRRSERRWSVWDTTPRRCLCSLDLSSLPGGLDRLGAEAVFNLVELLDGIDSLLYLPLAVLDSLGIPYAGSRTAAMFLTSNKPLAKRWMRGAGLPTPDWIESADTANTASDIKPRPLVAPEQPPAFSRDAANDWIVKGVWEHGSDGMEDDALLKSPSPDELRRRLRDRHARTGRRCFAERFIEGREFAVALLAGSASPETLPPAEIDFSAFPDGKPRMVGYRAKWSEDCFEFRNTPRRFDFPPSDRPLLDRLRQLSLDCWRAFGLRGWVRVDFRVDESGQPWILDINANPCISPDAGFAAMLREASIPFDRAVERILEDGVR